ncbi:MAG: 50S ribosomal protein L28 [Mycobacteriales bacterium]
MASTCEVCGKAPSFGHRVSRLGKNAQVRIVKSRSKRRWNPNIQTVRAQVAPGTRRRVSVCTSCLKAGKVTR